ncbi:ATP-binding cassette domain-containing protein [Marinitenerispora sediminis]|uniref:ABC transporter n=1 Tax=Marinitenerispora sediminis TaxID=1931232 RepID=A0A368T1S1_9ACTN|nr:ABC transporter ATP-binding protein [Marinitenerispora sediminis]RCV50668.1 ABC transporter [Marinitenerispora sediminis]RCV54154.1 ABC transporter [Marinitenerispora sediminis]RCV54894.1 ABC transporter [Marinitenerispora sediminis]
MHLHQVAKRYHRTGPWVVREVDLDIPPSSLVQLHGGNGRGKSTLLRLVAGLSTPTTGRVVGRPRTAYVPERFPPALPFTAEGYLRRLGRVHGLGHRESARRADRWVERLNLGAHARTPLHRLSKGTTQKVAVAQALMADPDLLVLDEAWTGLDQDARAVLDAAVRDRVAEGGSVVFVDHDPARLASSVTAAYEVVDGRLRPGTVPEPLEPAVLEPGPVVVEVAGPAGADEVPLPAALPGAPLREAAGRAVVRLTVAAADSDALLRAVLAARPPLHVRSVRPADDPARSAREDAR